MSFGASRELAFQHAKSRDLLYFPQTNGMLFFFGRDVNIRWRQLVEQPVRACRGRGCVCISCKGKRIGPMLIFYDILILVYGVHMQF